MAHIGFKKLVKNLENQGKSPKQAGGIAYAIGAKKYGKQGMARKAAAGRKKA